LMAPPNDDSIQRVSECECKAGQQLVDTEVRCRPRISGAQRGL